MRNPVHPIAHHRVPVNSPVPVCAVVGRSGSGKTTLIEALLPRFAEVGLRVAVIKHAHAATELDKPGKDSHRAAEAGAAQVIVASRAGYAVIERTPAATDVPSLEFLISRLDLSRIDFVLAEGFHYERVPKVEVVRGQGEMLCEGDSDLIAVAGAQARRRAGARIDFDLDVPDEIAAFISGHLGLRASGHQESA